MNGFETEAGESIDHACKRAVAWLLHHMAEGVPNSSEVTFDFNDTPVTATVNSDPKDLVAKWVKDSDARREAYLNSQEYKDRQASEAAQHKRKSEAAMKETAQTEEEMREAKEPWPYTIKQLAEYIDSLVYRQHDYGTCVYAMSLAAVAAFNYVARELGTTGFQSSCADLDIIRRTRHIDGPFMLIKAEDALYPQYDLHGKLTETIVSWHPWLADEAKKKLANGDKAAPTVKDHWEKLSVL